MNWSDIADGIGAIAPGIGAALGGPAGAAIGTGLAGLLGVDNNPESVKDAVKSEQARLKLQEIERSYSLGVLRAELSDKQNARKQHKGHWMTWVLTLILAVMVGGVCTALVVVTVPESNKSILYMLSGQLITAFITAVAFWLGTSRSSHDKNNWIKK